MVSLKLKKHYSFSTHAPSILGSSYDDMRLVCILDYDEAIKIDNVELLHKQVYPYLPEGTSSDNYDYTYLVFVDKYSKRRVIAQEWVIQESVQEISTSVSTIQLINVSQEEIAVVCTQLRLLGISFSVK